MLYKKPKDDHKYEWTNHVVGKMAYYGISESLVKRVVRFPKRVEVGIAPGTTAGMSPYGTPTKDKRQPYRGEIWVMWRPVAEIARPRTDVEPAFGTKGRLDKRDMLPKGKSNFGSGTRKLIISAWRYPGVSQPGQPIPIPDDILAEISQE